MNCTASPAGDVVPAPPCTVSTTITSTLPVTLVNAGAMYCAGAAAAIGAALKLYAKFCSSPISDASGTRCTG